VFTDELGILRIGAGPCIPARQYFSDYYVEGNVDFIFGDAQTYFENCQINAVADETVFSQHRAGIIPMKTVVMYLTIAQSLPRPRFRIYF